jgi:hypothetical protein
VLQALLLLLLLLVLLLLLPCRLAHKHGVPNLPGQGEKLLLHDITIHPIAALLWPGVLQHMLAVRQVP